MGVHSSIYGNCSNLPSELFFPYVIPPRDDHLLIAFERRPSEPPHGAGRLHRNAVLSSCDLEKDYLQWPVITKMKCRNFNPHVWRFPGCWQRRDEISLFKSKLATSSPFASNLGLGFLPRSRPKMKTGKRGKNLPVESIETDGGELNF